MISGVVLDFDLARVLMGDERFLGKSRYGFLARSGSARQGFHAHK